MPLTANYPHVSATGLPIRLTAQQVWAVALSVRNQLTGDPWRRRVEVEEIVSGSAAVSVNGLEFGAIWDFDHVVSNERGEPVMGLAHFDKSEPDHVYVSINGAALAGQDDLLRSTVAHELGHVLFDGPGWILSSARRCAKPRDGRLASAADLARADAPRKERTARGEFRANEFMGGLHTPPCLLRIDLQRYAKRNRLPTSPVPSRIVRGSPAYDSANLDEDAVSDLLFTLADTYQVSKSFICVRLDRYDLLRTRNIDNVK